LNVHKGFSFLHRRFVLHDLRDAIRELSADVVFLQEVLGDHQGHSRRQKQWPKESQYEFLADTVWKSYAYGKNAVYPEGHHGNALLSKLPIVQHHNEDLTIVGAERRGLLHAVLDLPEREQQIHAICVHMSLFESHRAEQAERLAAFIDAEVPRDAPLIVAGDFNDWRKRMHSAMGSIGLREAFEDSRGALARSFPVMCPLLRLDRIYLRHLHGCEPEVLSGPPWSRLSDHAALTVEVRLT
jgi:endonuclease/exonuclease/phosphatase family metal-dependent hydrolase